MAQRVVIAIAICLDPKLLIADEPTTALDLTVQRQLLEMIRDLVREAERSMLLVTHDLSVVGSYCDRVVVMYAGKVVEQGPTEQVFTRPSHPYTAALLAAVPGSGTAPVPLRGTVPNLIDYPRGCPYADRCARSHGPLRRRGPATARAGRWAPGLLSRADRGGGPQCRCCTLRTCARSSPAARAPPSTPSTAST